MEKVAGIGGLFFRAHDPNLGIAITPTSEGAAVWQQEAGPTVFTPFPETSKYFGDPNKVWMVNFRVRDLDKMVTQLRMAGIEVNSTSARNAVFFNEHGRLRRYPPIRMFLLLDFHIRLQVEDSAHGL